MHKLGTASSSDTAVWHGAPEEWTRLCQALSHHCTCAVSRADLGLCPGHTLLNDQRSLDHLLFGYRIRVRLLREEWHLGGGTE